MKYNKKKKKKLKNMHNTITRYREINIKYDQKYRYYWRSLKY